MHTHIHITTETNIMVGHRTKSEQKHHMPDHKSKWSTKMSYQNYIIFIVYFCEEYVRMYVEEILMIYCGTIILCALLEIVHIQCIRCQVMSYQDLLYPDTW